MLKKLAVVASGAALAQVFTLLISPLLTRSYTPSDFGYLGAVLSVSSILSVVVHGRLNLAIGLPKSNRVARNLFIFSTVFALLASMFVGVALSVLGWLGFLSNAGALGFALLVAGLTYCNAQIDINSYWQGRCKRFDLTAKNSVLRSLGTGGGQLILSGATSGGLAIGALFGAFLSVLVSFFGMRVLAQFSRDGLAKTLKAGWWCAKRYKNFPLLSMPQGLLASFGLNSAPLIMGWFFGASAVGQYWLAYRVLVAPIGLLGNAYRQVSLSQVGGQSQSYQRRRAGALLHTYILGAGGTLLSFFLGIVGPDLFAWIFGPEWRLAGEIAGWLALAFMADLMKVPSTTLIHYLGLHKQLLRYEIVLSVVRVVSLLFCSRFFGFLEAVVCFSLVGCCAAMVLVFWVFKYKKED